MLKDKLLSLARGAAIAAVGAALAYAAQWLACAADANDLGAYGPALAAILAVAVNAARKALERSSAE